MPVRVFTIFSVFVTFYFAIQGLPSFQNYPLYFIEHFLCISGTNILFVGVHGPKGPCEDINIKHTGRNQYNVSYMVRERGEYIVLVKWGDDHIPGSPFKVDV